jgi:amino acid adenylation domain-containing protein
MIVGLLGILKAGAAYVPLDPGYPGERLAFMLEDAQVPILLTQQRLVCRLPKHGATAVCLDTDWEIMAKEGTENPTRNVKADNLAYVIYTSGSTGKPKGVQIEHQGLLNLVFWHQRAFALSPADRATQIAGPAFDAAVWELWPYLTVGASIYIANEETRISPVELRDWLIASAITITFLPTPLAESVLSLDWPSNTALQTLLTGGDKLHNYPSRSLPFKLVNNYGPTENTVVTTSGDVGSMAQSDRTPTIGRPIANTQVYLLDKNLQPVPVGIPGEIYVGGAGLARGYLNHPDQTILAFIPNPFSNTPSRRLYKTGDLGRYLPDGNIEFLGRLDDQVKIRGFRIELGEIEAVLGQHPAVAETVVVVREDVPGSKRLVAYVVVNQVPAPTIPELQEFLKQHLPEYMVPSAFVQLSVLPLTPNGKVDRRALPAPDKSCFSLKASFVSPRDILELQLVQIWEEVLDVHPVGVRDNFFDLGGHSLLAITLMARIQQKFGKNLPLATLFQGATIENLASSLRPQTDSPSWSTLIAIQPDGPKRPLFCVHPGGGTVLEYIHLARHLGSEQPFYGLESLGLYEEEKSYARVEDMATHYIEAMQVVQPQGPYLLAGWCFGGLVAFEMAQQLQAQSQEVSFLGLMDISAHRVASEEFEELEVEDDAAFLVKVFAKDISFSLDRIRQLGSDEQLLYVIEKVKQLNLIPPDVGLAQARYLVQMLKSHIGATKAYIPQPYRGRATLFRASEEAANSQDLTLGWEEVAAEGLDLHLVPGNHATMVVEPHVQVLAKQLRACLEQSQAND